MPRVYSEEIKLKAIELRKQGFSYSEIPKLLNYQIPKNTFTAWFKNVELSEQAKQRIMSRIREGGGPGRAIAWANTKRKREELLKGIYDKANHEIEEIDKLTAKLCLAMLYLGEGGKTGEWVRFGNSDPKIIELFMVCLRSSFEINEERLRGKVQCRADQNIADLTNFWSSLTKIPTNQFHKPFVDKRTLGNPTKRLDYKGVFVVIYCSNEIFLELKYISDIIYHRLVK